MLAEINCALMKEFQNPKLKLQCIMEIKEIKQQFWESIWDYDQSFDILLDRMTFQIPNTQQYEWFIT